MKKGLNKSTVGSSAAGKNLMHYERCEDIYMECTGRYTLKGARMHKPYPSTRLWSVADIISKRARTWLCPTTIYYSIKRGIPLTPVSSTLAPIPTYRPHPFRERRWTLYRYWCGVSGDWSQR